MRRLIHNTLALALIGLLAMAASAANAQIASAPMPGRDLQALSCNNTIPNATPQGPRQALINCAGDLTFFDAYLLSDVTNKLERVTLRGKANSPWKTLCIGNECLAFLGIEAAATRVKDAVGRLAAYIFSLFVDDGTLKMAACTAQANIPESARNVTSLDEDFLRNRAAGEIIVAHMRGGNFANTNGVEVAITYSDKGTQTFLYNSANPAAPIPKGPVEAGDGVSRCP